MGRDFTLINGGKKEELNQELEALDHQVAQIEKFRRMSPRQRECMMKCGLREDLEDLTWTVSDIYEKYCAE
jgi:hypothetical protein